MAPPQINGTQPFGAAVAGRWGDGCAMIIVVWWASIDGNPDKHDPGIVVSRGM